MQKFQVGDAVKIVGTTTHSSQKAGLGYVGIITSYTELKLELRLGDGHYMLDGRVNVWENDLRLIGQRKENTMSKFKDGDEVICVDTDGQGSSYGGDGWELGKVFKVDSISTGHSDFGDILWPGNGKSGVYSKFVALKSSKKSFMQNITEWIKNARRGEPEKSFIEAGVMDQDEQLTTEGKKLLMDFVLKENKTKFNEEVVQPYLKAQREEAKK